MKPNKSYKALMVEIQTAEKVKRLKPDSMTMTQFLEYLLSLSEEAKAKKVK